MYKTNEYLLELFNMKDSTIINVNLINNKYKICYIPDNTSFNFKSEGNYNDVINDELPNYLLSCNVVSYDKSKMVRVLNTEYLLSCFRMERCDYYEKFNLVLADEKKIIFNIRIIFDMNNNESMNATLIFSFKEEISTNKDKFLSIWENKDDYVFIHELDVSNWKLTFLKYPEESLPEIKDIKYDYNFVKDLYILKFGNKVDFEIMEEKFEKKNVIYNVYFNGGVYYFDIRFMRTDGSIEWYELSYILSEKYTDKVIITVKNIEESVRKNMQEEIQRAAFDDMYSCIIYYNFTRNVYNVVSTNYPLNNDVPINISDMIQHMANKMEEKTKHKFLKIFNINNLIDMCKKKDKFKYEVEDFVYYGIKCDLEFIFKRITNPKGEICCALLIRDIRQQKIEMKENRLRQNIMNVALSKIYSTLIMINITKDEYTMVKNDIDNVTHIDKYGKLTELYQKTLKNIHKDSYNTFLEAMNIERLKREFKHGTKDLGIRYKKLDLSGEYVWMKLQVVFISNPIDLDQLGLVFVRNISEDMENEAKIQDALDKANKANEAKTKFLFNMSHDIRTPMNAIMGYSELIEVKAYENDLDFIKNNIVNVRNASKHLLNLINDILCMSAIENGKSVLNVSSIKLKEEIDRIYSMTKIIAHNNKIIYNFKYESITDDVVIADGTKLEQMIVNIIGNALKFTTEDGRVYVYFSKIESDKQGYNKYYFECKDNGIGMSEEFQKKIFLPFERAYSSYKTQKEGTGLGMSITKNIIDLMDGTITIKSKENVGTTVSVEIYLKVSDIIPNAVECKLQIPETFENMCILIAEDKTANYEVIRLMLEKYKIKLEHALNGEEAVNMLRNSSEHYYDLIFMDIQMPVMNGYDSCKAIKLLERDDVKDIPIIAMTANAFVEDINNAKEAGMSGYIAKPVSREIILSEISKYYKWRKSDYEDNTEH